MKTLTIVILSLTVLTLVAKDFIVAERQQSELAAEHSETIQTEQPVQVESNNAL